MSANFIWVWLFWNYINLLNYYLPQTKFGEGNVFTSVCLSTRQDGGGDRGVGNIKYIVPLATSTGGGNWHFARTVSKRAVCILFKCCLIIYYYFKCRLYMWININSIQLNWIIPRKRVTYLRKIRPHWISLMRRDKINVKIKMKLS